MAKFKVDANGNLLGADGNALVIGEEPVKLADIEGVVSQQVMDTKIQERLARQTEQIRTLEAQAGRTAETERLLETLKADKAQLEQAAAAARETAAQEAQAQVKGLTTERDSLRTQLEAERAGRIQDQVSALVLGKCADRFNAPAIDIVPNLLRVHKREEEKGEDGKPTGKVLDFFRLSYKNDAGQDVEEWLPVDKALEVWANLYPHHVRPSGHAGSGGGNYGQQQGANPWKKDTWNVTEQQRLMVDNPAKAKALMGAAGVPVPSVLA